MTSGEICGQAQTRQRVVRLIRIDQKVFQCHQRPSSIRLISEMRTINCLRSYKGIGAEREFFALSRRFSTGLGFRLILFTA
jgi:hypothetical protein